MQENGEKFMTPYDILRALALEPESHLDQASYCFPDFPPISSYPPSSQECTEAQDAIATVFQLADLNFDGHISFPEFLFFLHLLTSTPFPFFFLFLFLFFFLFSFFPDFCSLIQCSTRCPLSCGFQYV